MPDPAGLSSVPPVAPWLDQADPVGRASQAAAPAPCHGIRSKQLPADALPCPRPGLADPSSLAPISLTLAAGVLVGAGLILLRKARRIEAGPRKQRSTSRPWRIGAWLFMVAALGCVVLIAAGDLPFW